MICDICLNEVKDTSARLIQFMVCPDCRKQQGYIPRAALEAVIVKLEAMQEGLKMWDEDYSPLTEIRSEYRAGHGVGLSQGLGSAIDRLKPLLNQEVKS